MVWLSSTMGCMPFHVIVWVYRNSNWVYRNSKRYFAPSVARTTRRVCSGKAVRPACFLRIPGSIFYLYTVHMSSIFAGNSWHFHCLSAIRGGAYGASDATYAPRDPSRTGLYHMSAEHLETFLASLNDDPDTAGLPAYVQWEFYDYVQCGILAHGFLRLGCDTCKHELLLPFSCKRRGFCPSCAGRRMAQMAAHLVERVFPWVRTRQWVVSVPVPLRDWMAASQERTAKVQTLMRTTSGQYSVNQAVKQGSERATVHPGEEGESLPEIA